MKVNKVTPVLPLPLLLLSIPLLPPPTTQKEMVSTCEPLCQFTERLYFTAFPHPVPTAHTLNRLAADPATHPPRVRARPRGGPASTPDDLATYYWFTIDEQLVYLSFYQDWGPLNLAMVYKVCILIHELLEDADLKSQRLVLYASDDPRRKANAALLMALYVMIVERRAPWEAFQPIAEVAFMPFRDAGRGPSDFNLSIQDCLWGLWKAMQNGLCDMNEFNVDDYEYYEKVENGDWNWLTPHFIAFASPVDPVWIKRDRDREQATEQGAGTVKGKEPPASSTSSNHALQRKLPTPYTNCLDYFAQRNVRLVVRLNTHLYDRATFLERGIDHMELYFDDGTNPTDEIVRTFLDVADRVIEGGGAVAVHCKAGLGRTGTLIGAYLIWKYGFTANEAIAFMRIVRPGSVVGPQQQYLYLKQLEWAKWAAVDEMKRAQAQQTEAEAEGAADLEADVEVDSAREVEASLTGESVKGKGKEREAVVPVPLQAATPPSEDDDKDDPMHGDAAAVGAGARPATPPPRTVGVLPPVTPSRHVLEATAKARAIATPGQPRKTPKRMAQDSDEEDDGVDGVEGDDDAGVERRGVGERRKVDEKEEEEDADDEEDEMDDVLPALGVAPPAVRKIKAVPRPRGQHLGATASVDRAERVTRSTAGAAGMRKVGMGAGAGAGMGVAAGRGVASTRAVGALGAGVGVAPPASPVKPTKKAVAVAGRAGNSSGPNKIPRLATTRTTAAAAKALGGATATATTTSGNTTIGTTGTKSGTGKGPAVVRARPAPGAGISARPVRKAAVAAGAGARAGSSTTGVAAAAIGTRARAAAAAQKTGSNANSTARAPPSTPSRLPTLLKRPGGGATHANSLSDVPGLSLEQQKRAGVPVNVTMTIPMPGTPGGPLGTSVNGATGVGGIGGGALSSPDAWVANNVAVAAVMLPASKSGERPGLRSSVRRRRSSFSSADVVA